MKIYVIGSSKTEFLPLDNIRQKFLVDVKHDGDNIDSLNKWYCELTGLYYLWKNENDNIVGLEHYRRYFINDHGYLLNENEISNILKENDIICCSFNTLASPSGKCSVFDYYKKYHSSEFGTDKILQLVNTLDFEKSKNYFCGGEFIVFNAFICKKEIINEYCTWLFDNLFKFDTSLLKNRELGYLGEYIFGCWLFNKGLKLYRSEYKVLK